MNFIARNTYRLRAEHCSQKSDMARDEKIKKFWEDLADEWIALDDKKRQGLFEEIRKARPPAWPVTSRLTGELWAVGLIINFLKDFTDLHLAKVRNRTRPFQGHE
jgi:hypothetical protein